MKTKWSLVVSSLLFLCYYISDLTKFEPAIRIGKTDCGKYLTPALLVLAVIVLIFYLFVQQKIASKFKSLIVKWNIIQIILFFLFVAANIFVIFFSSFLGQLNPLNLLVFICVNYVIINLFLSPKSEDNN